MRNRPIRLVFLHINTRNMFATMVLQKSKTKGGGCPNTLRSFYFAAKQK